MSVLTNRRTWILGFLTWLIPFVASLPFFDQNGELVGDIFTFKATMSLLYTAVSVFFIVLVLRDKETDFFTAGLVLGLVWTALNLVMDLIVLVGLFGNEPATWFWQTGVGYFNMIPLGLAIGWLLATKLNRSDTIAMTS